MAGGVPAKDFITLLKGESLVAFAPLDEVLAIGTAQGVVKRVQPDYPLNREDWEVIALKDKDTVVGVAPAGPDDVDLVFVTRQAQLLRFAASAVRPQGRTAGGMAGIKLAAGDRVMFFGAAGPADAAAVVVTIAGTDGRPARAPRPGPPRSRRSPSTRPRAAPPPGSGRTASSRARTPCCSPGPGTARRRRPPWPGWPAPCPASTAAATAPASRCPRPSTRSARAWPGPPEPGAEA